MFTMEMMGFIVMIAEWKKTKEKQQNLYKMLKELKSYVNQECYYSAWYLCSKIIDELKK